MLNPSDLCGCCEGTDAITPEPVANRPGLAALVNRTGTHATFLETMKARLSGRDYPALGGLTTRAPNDPSIALLDAWAIVADVLTFYQERIANEGYLRTATERRSVLELARLIGYALRPGVAASVWLALELDKDHEVVIQPHEIKAQSVPGPGEMPQTFENVEPLDARYGWNKLQPRLAQPQTLVSIQSVSANGDPRTRLHVKGINTNLKPNDVVLITTSDLPYRTYHVAEVTPDPANDRTLVIFQEGVKRAQPAHEAFDASAIAAAAERYATAELATHGVSPDSKMAQRVTTQLKALSERTRAADITAESAERAVSETLASIAEEKEYAVLAPYPRLANWLTAMIQELNEAAQGVKVAAAREKAFAFAAAISPIGPAPTAAVFSPPEDPLRGPMAGLTKRASVPPRNALSLERSLARAFDARTDIGLQLAGAFDSKVRQSLPAALANVKVTPDSTVRAYTFRAVARPFGHNAPPRAVLQDGDNGKYTSYHEWTINDPTGSQDPLPESSDNPTTPPGLSSTENTGSRAAAAGAPPPPHGVNSLYLDAEYGIKPDSWIVIQGPDVTTKLAPIHLESAGGNVAQQSLAAYGVSGKATRLDLGKETWIQDKDDFSVVRQTIFYVASEELPLAEAPIEDPICGGEDDSIELDRLYSGLQSGRWLVVAGERDDILDESGNKVRGVKAAELVMLAEVTHQVKQAPSGARGYSRYGYGYGQSGLLPGDRTHTFIKLAKTLAYCYRRETVALYGNVVKATHGETRKETLGSGDASRAFQAFTLKQQPLTFVASPTAAGAESTLNVYVNDVRWHEADGLADLAPADRKFVTKTGNDSKTTAIFGNGQRGARLPTGVANVRAEYRSGIGRAGNVMVEQISLLLSKPLGVKGVINPLRASGGADREGRDTARKNAPLTVTALDRLVSVPDYADFARTFAGIGKAVSARITDGRREWMHVTIAGADDIPIDETSDLYRNLLQALRDYGDPYQPVALQARELMLLVVSANVRTLPDYQWETVAKAVRARLLDTFSFERRELGQDVFLSEMIAAIQSVSGVAYVDVDALGGVQEKKTDFDNEGRPVRRLLTPKEIAGEANVFLQGAAAGKPKPRVPVNLAGVEGGAMRPAQLAYLTPDVADTLVLNQIK